MTNLKKAPVSVCIIAKNESGRIERCLQSIRDHVEEIVVVDTGSTDDTPEIAKKYADIFEVFTGCNDEQGRIEDFSLARNRSFDLATKDWAIWVDADDVVHNFEKINDIIEQYKNHPGNILIAFPYHYAHDDKGNVIVSQYRERLVYPRHKFHWLDPVHEVIEMPKDGMLFNTHEEIIFVHQRGNKVNEPNRNLRILEKLYEKNGESNPRHLYYLGLEYGNVCNHPKMIEMLTKYIDLSGWDDERYMACLRMCYHYVNVGEYQNAINIALKAIGIKEDWGEAFFVLSKCYYLLADIGKTPERNYERCIYFAKHGLSLPPTKTLLFVNPMERDLEIHKFLNIALSKLNRYEEALESCENGLKKDPNHPWLVCNRKVYKNHLSRHKLNLELGDMLRNELISKVNYDSIMNVLDNKSCNLTASSEIKVPFNQINQSSFLIPSKGAHSQAWVIPETFDLQDLPLNLSLEQLEVCVLMIWKQYILHDEILTGINFLENAPVEIRHRASIERALKINKEMIAWIHDPVLIEKLNAPGNPEVEAGMPLPKPLVWQEKNRFDLIADHLPSTPQKLVDFGCMDGCFTNRYGLLGHQVIGLDLCRSSVTLANKKAAEFNTGVQHVVTYFKDANLHIEDHSQDYVTTSDSYEHLLDPIEEMFIPAKKMLKQGTGKFLLVTPYKSWMRGKFVKEANPWVSMLERNINWLDSYPHKNHLVAPTQWSVANQLKSLDFYIYNSYVSLCSPNADVEGQGNVFVEAWLQPPENSKPLDIIFFVGNGLELWNPESIKKTGIGGSELMEAQLATLLAARGNRVRVYNGCGDDGEGIYQGVEYYQTNKFQDLKCDVLITSRYANMLNDVYNIDAKIKIIHCHDVCAINATNKLLLKADKILALSNWHKNYLVDYHNVHSDHVHVTRNGIYPERFENKKIERNPHKIMVSSSPDRGWDTILDLFPLIKAKIPDAELHLFYGFKNAEVLAGSNPTAWAEILRLKSKAEVLKEQGVVIHDRVNQEELANQMLSSGVWCHLTNFTESSCIGAMEAQMAGCHVVSSSCAALNETVSHTERKISNPDCYSEGYRQQALTYLIEALQDHNENVRQNRSAWAKEEYNLYDLAQDWEALFHQWMKDKDNGYVVPYQPTPNFVNGRADE